MPEGRFAEIVILAEDRVQVRFIRGWLARHVAHRRIVDLIPIDGGSGEQFVRLKFPTEADRHGQRSARRSSMLIAVIDADTGQVSARYRELLGHLSFRTGVFIFVPKRNIETWLHHLNESEAEEETDYKPLYKKDPAEAIRAAAAKFLELIRSPDTSGLIPSLARGVEEASRMPRVHEQPRG